MVLGFVDSLQRIQDFLLNQDASRPQEYDYQPVHLHVPGEGDCFNQTLLATNFLPYEVEGKGIKGKVEEASAQTEGVGCGFELGEEDLGNEKVDQDLGTGLDKSGDFEDDFLGLFGKLELDQGEHENEHVDVDEDANRQVLEEILPVVPERLRDEYVLAFQHHFEAKLVLQFVIGRTFIALQEAVWTSQAVARTADH